MTLFFSLLPLYLFGNIHCLGMCGPLVMLIGKHRFRLFYFAGRLLSYSLAGWLAGEAGTVLHLVLRDYHLAEAISGIFGLTFIIWGVVKLIKTPSITLKKGQSPSRFKQWLSMLLLKDTGWSTFLFGFFTVMLPCGQTLVVFSACALSGDPWVGLLNGFALALLTTPSLALAMQTLSLFKQMKHFDRYLLGCCAIAVGLIALCRALAELDYIDHWVINPHSNTFHLVIF